MEDYLAAFPELGAGGPPCDLIYEEFHVRKRAGEPVRPEDYLARFPGERRNSAASWAWKRRELRRR